MRYAGTIVMLVLVALLAASCADSGKGQRDILLEALESFEDVFETPLTRGGTVYSKYCSVCHGSQGNGDGFNAYNLATKPRNFTDTSFVNRLDSNLIIETVSKGGGVVGLSSLMPAWGHTLSEEDIIYVSNYVTYLAQSAKEKEK